MKAEVVEFHNDGGQGVDDVALKENREVYLTIGGETACLVELDGHHKVAAAASEHLPVQWLVFLPHQHLGRDVREMVGDGAELLRLLTR